MKYQRSVEMRKMVNNATNATVFYNDNNNVPPIVQG